MKQNDNLNTQEDNNMYTNQSDAMNGDSGMVDRTDAAIELSYIRQGETEEQPREAF